MPSSAWRLELRRVRSEEHTSELQSPTNLVCRLLLEKTRQIHRSPPVARPEAPDAASPGRPPQAPLRGPQQPRAGSSPRPPPAADRVAFFFFNERATTKTQPPCPPGPLPT